MQVKEPQFKHLRNNDGIEINFSYIRIYIDLHVFSSTVPFYNNDREHC